MYGPQFPMYWYSMPAILKGWMDRIFCQGFAFDFPGFFDEGLLKVHGLEGNPGRVRGISRVACQAPCFPAKAQEAPAA